MKTISFNGDVYQSKKIIKTDTSIIGYNGETEVFRFCGIKDFSQFQLDNGQEYDLSDGLKNDLSIAEAYESLYIENLQNSLAIAELYEIIIGGAE